MTTIQEWANQYIGIGCNDPKPSIRQGWHKSDDVLLYCEPCGQVWNWYVTSHGRKWCKYPKGNIPTINKKRTKCPICSKGGRSEV